MGRNFKFALGFIGFLWLVFLVNKILPAPFQNFGIEPRSIHGLFGIFIAPFLHVKLGHLTGNSVALISILFVSLCYDFSATWKAMAIIVAISGFGTWIFGEVNTVHFGASVFVYGLLAFLLFAGFFRKNFSSVPVVLGIVFIFGPLLWDLLSVVPGISWSGHFFGLVGGIVAGKLLKISPSDDKIF